MGKFSALKCFMKLRISCCPNRYRFSNDDGSIPPSQFLYSSQLLIWSPSARPRRRVWSIVGTDLISAAQCYVRPWRRAVRRLSELPAPFYQITPRQPLRYVTLRTHTHTRTHIRVMQSKRGPWFLWHNWGPTLEDLLSRLDFTSNRGPCLCLISQQDRGPLCTHASPRTSMCVSSQMRTEKPRTLVHTCAHTSMRGPARVCSLNCGPKNRGCVCLTSEH